MCLILHVLFKLHVLEMNVATIPRVHPSTMIITNAYVATIHLASVVGHVSYT